MKVLVVDDSRVARRIVAKHLQATPAYEAAEVLEAPSGEAGLTLFDASIDIVISDWNMPGISGLQFIQKLREQEKSWLNAETKGVPVVMITTEGTIDKVMEALDAGVNEYVIKPFTIDTLIAALDRVTQV